MIGPGRDALRTRAMGRRVIGTGIVIVRNNPRAAACGGGNALSTRREFGRPRRRGGVRFTLPTGGRVVPCSATHGIGVHRSVGRPFAWHRRRCRGSTFRRPARRLLRRSDMRPKGGARGERKTNEAANVGGVHRNVPQSAESVGVGGNRRHSLLPRIIEPSASELSSKSEKSALSEIFTQMPQYETAPA